MKSNISYIDIEKKTIDARNPIYEVCYTSGRKKFYALSALPETVRTWLRSRVDNADLWRKLVVPAVKTVNGEYKFYEIEYMRCYDNDAFIY